MSIASSSRDRFVRDLTRLREQQGMSLDELSVRTKVARSTLEEFEQARLLENPLFNVVYLKSLARTYARHVGLSADVMKQALEEMLASQYTGRLSPGYIEQDEAPAEDAQPLAEQALPHPPGPSEEAGETAATAPPAGDTFTAVLAGVTKQQAAPPNSSRRFRRRTGLRPLWVACALLLVAAIVAVAFWLFPGPGVPSDGDTSEMALVDTAASDSQAAVEAVQFGTRIHVTALATGLVERLQVRIDDDLRRPYWIESDSALVFSFGEQITLERRLHLIRLFADSYEIALDTVDVERPFVLSRGMLEQLAAEGRLVATDAPPANDTIRVGP